MNDQPVGAGCVVVEIDGSADGLRVVDYAARQALRTGSDLLLVRPYRTFGTYSAGARFHPPCQRDEAGGQLRQALAHVRRQIGHGQVVDAVAREGHRIDVLAQFGQRARMLVVPRQRVRGRDRLVAAQADIALAARSAAPVIVVPRTWKPSSADHSVTVGIDGPAIGDPVAREALAAATCPVALLRHHVTAQGERRPHAASTRC
jgi:hypothetical protein